MLAGTAGTLLAKAGKDQWWLVPVGEGNGERQWWIVALWGWSAAGDEISRRPTPAPLQFTKMPHHIRTTDTSIIPNHHICFIRVLMIVMVARSCRSGTGCAIGSMRRSLHYISGPLQSKIHCCIKSVSYCPA